ncbi:uncharacterized protein RSE6_09178 [Rhynchosporium secalis]|uniref:Uncharacterized protein n=1 Tax=Rhynchosporium secalis TaxID=38038 RepID=A0A1E1MHB0_RHYSE|nr:uncharacterized protein RSE6_09178 [Rhynchosporium secalis]
MSMRLKVEDRIWKAPSRYLGNLQFGSVILYPICRTGRIMARSTLDFKEIDKHIGTHSRMNFSSNSLFGKLHEQWNFWKIWNNRGHLVPTTQTRRRLHNRLPTTEFSSLYDIGAVLPLPLDRRRVVRKSWLVFVDVQAHKRGTLGTNWGPPGKCNSQFHIPDCLERALKLTGGCLTRSVSWNGSWGRVIWSVTIKMNAMLFFGPSVIKELYACIPLCFCSRRCYSAWPALARIGRFWSPSKGFAYKEILSFASW